MDVRHQEVKDPVSYLQPVNIGTKALALLFVVSFHIIVLKSDLVESCLNNRSALCLLHMCLLFGTNLQIPAFAMISK